MIVVRAPLRISFAGGGTDLPAFYHRHAGRVLSATIDKFVYLVIKPTTLVNKFIVKYQETESVEHPEGLKHDRVRETLLDLGITKGGLEIGSFADLPAKTGLGSSSSFSVALVKGMHAYLGKKLSAREAAEKACRLELSLLREPIGKQDQYAASFGGFNVFQFNKDESVSVRPLFVGFKTRSLLESHALLFFTGLSRHAGDVLSVQQKTLPAHLAAYKKMADSVLVCEEALMQGDMAKLGNILLRGWELKKSLASPISNGTVDALFAAGLAGGAWGGKGLGAGGGGCIFFLAPPARHAKIRKAVRAAAARCELAGFCEIPFSFTQSGTDILLHTDVRP